MQRIPRPLGVSLYNKQEINQLAIIIVKQWASNQFRLNDRVVNINKIAEITNMSIAEVQKYMYEAMKDMGRIWENREETQGNARVLFSQAIIWGLEIQSRMALQADLLEASQGGEYRPFISSTLNQALANMSTAQGPMLQLLKMLTEKQNVNIIYNANTSTDEQNRQNLTTEQAIQIIRSNGPSMLQDPHLAEIQIEKYKATLQLPNVNARTQDLRSIGIKHNGQTPTDNTPSNLSNIDAHIDRRERDFGPIESAEDFIA